MARWHEAFDNTRCRAAEHLMRVYRSSFDDMMPRRAITIATLRRAFHAEDIGRLSGVRFRALQRF